MTDEEWLEFSAEIWFCVFLHPSKKMGKRRRDRAMKRLQEQHPDIHRALWSLVGKKLDAVLDSLPKRGTLKELAEAGDEVERP